MLRNSAIPDTLGNSGIMVDEESPEEIGEIIDIVIKDEKLKDKIIQQQRKRLADFEKKETENELKKQIRVLLNNEK